MFPQDDFQEYCVLLPGIYTLLKRCKHLTIAATCTIAAHCFFSCHLTKLHIHIRKRIPRATCPAAEARNMTPGWASACYSREGRADGCTLPPERGTVQYCPQHARLVNSGVFENGVQVSRYERCVVRFSGAARLLC